MLTRAEYAQAFGIISILPCQKHAMNGLPSLTNPAAISPFSICQRPVCHTSRIYRAVSQLNAATTAGLREMFRSEPKDQACATAAGSFPSSSANCIAYSFA